MGPSDSSHPKLAGGFVVTDEKLLHRQIRESGLKDDRRTVKSTEFLPLPKDDSKLSVDDGDRVGAEASWQRFVDRGWDSIGVLSITDSECREQGLSVEAKPEKGNPEHTVVDFAPIPQKPRSARKRVATKLRDHAVARGWQTGGPDAGVS